jgi:hypothetical protein
MGPPSYMRSVVDRNVVMRRILVHSKRREVKRLNLWFIRCVAMGRGGGWVTLQELQCGEPVLRSARGSTICVPRSRNCISCVPSCQPQIWQVASGSHEIVSVASRVVNPKYDKLRPAVKKLYQLRPELSTPNMTNCVRRLVRNCFSCNERYETQNVQQLEGPYTVLLFFASYTIIWTHTELLSDINNVQLLCQCLSYIKNIFWTEDRHITFLISSVSTYCYDLIKTVSGKSFNAVMQSRSTKHLTPALTVLI